MNSQQNRRMLVLIPAAVFALVSPGTAVADQPDTTAKTRSFDFSYSATLIDLPAGKVARVWLPVPQTTEDQEVQIVFKNLPGEPRLGKETRYGNQMFYIEGETNADGKLPLSVTYRVTRREVRGETDKKSEIDPAMFLRADARVPIDGKPLELIRGKELPDDPMKKARLLYDVVNEHLRYSKEGTGWGRGDSDWACDSKYGNCSDFHSLFISLARSQKLPTKFEMGFPLPSKRGQGDIPGYHCWAKFKPEGKSWIPVDISEANKNPTMKDYYFGNLTEDRLTFTTGRDIDLAPKQAGPALNFFIYPYAEVEGQQYPDAKIQRKFSFKDVQPADGK